MIQSFLSRLSREAKAVTRADFYRVGRWFLMVNGAYALMAFAYLHQPYRVIYNNTWSMPRGFWTYDTRMPDRYALGERVSAHYHAPQWVKARNWYDPRQQSVVKRIGAVPGDHLKTEKGVIYNCGQQGTQCQVLARRLAWDSHYRPLYFTRLPAVVPAQSYFLVGENPISLDSRYLGLFTTNAIRGVAHPLYTAPIPKAAKQLVGAQVEARDLPVTLPKDEMIPQDQPLQHPQHWGYFTKQGRIQWEEKPLQAAHSPSPRAADSDGPAGPDNDFLHDSDRSAGTDDSNGPGPQDGAMTQPAAAGVGVTHPRNEVEGV